MVFPSILGLDHFHHPWLRAPNTSFSSRSTRGRPPVLTDVFGPKFTIIFLGKQETTKPISTPSEKYESQLGLLFPIYGKKQGSKPPDQSAIIITNNPAS